MCARSWLVSSSRAGRGSLGFAFHGLEFCPGRSPYAAEAAVVGSVAGIAVSGLFSLARGGATGFRTGFPTAAPDDAFHIRAGIRRPPWIDCWTFVVIGRAVNVLTPLGDVAVHIVESPA